MKELARTDLLFLVFDKVLTLLYGVLHSYLLTKIIEIMVCCKNKLYEMRISQKVTGYTLIFGGMYVREAAITDYTKHKGGCHDRKMDN